VERSTDFSTISHLARRASVLSEKNNAVQRGWGGKQGDRIYDGLGNNDVPRNVKRSTCGMKKVGRGGWCRPTIQLRLCDSSGECHKLRSLRRKNKPAAYGGFESNRSFRNQAEEESHVRSTRSFCHTKHEYEEIYVGKTQSFHRSKKPKECSDVGRTSSYHDERKGYRLGRMLYKSPRCENPNTPRNSNSVRTSVEVRRAKSTGVRIEDPTEKEIHRMGRVNSLVERTSNPYQKQIQRVGRVNSLGERRSDAFPKHVNRLGRVSSFGERTGDTGRNQVHRFGRVQSLTERIEEPMKQVHRVGRNTLIFNSVCLSHDAIRLENHSKKAQTYRVRTTDSSLLAEPKMGIMLPNSTTKIKCSAGFDSANTFSHT